MSSSSLEPRPTLSVFTPIVSLSDQRAHSPLVELSSNDYPLDLGRALPDAVDAELPEEAFGYVLSHVAAAPKDLHRTIRHAVGHLGGVELCHRALRVLGLWIHPGIDSLRETVSHKARRP